MGDSVKRTLNKVDPRLVEHGERVAYIALKILEEAEGEISHEMLKNVLLVCLIHDIGAYKTEEIDCIVEFESRNVWEHSIYGSLFLKMFSPSFRIYGGSALPSCGLLPDEGAGSERTYSFPLQMSLHWRTELIRRGRQRHK